MKLTYILRGDGLSNDDVSKLDRRASDKDFNNTEVIVYFTKINNYTGKPKKIIIVNPTKNGAVKKAIITACGEHLVFTTYKNFLHSKITSTIEHTNNQKGYQLALPVKNNKLLGLLGIRKLKNVPFVITSADFAKQYSELFDNLVLAIKRANKNLRIVRLSPNIEMSPEPIISSAFYIRPYIQIFRRYYYGFIHKVQAYLEKRRVDRLTRQVPPVPYSKNIPVFIICRDRVEPLKKLVKWCEDEGLKNIYFIDNASTYPKLLDYFKTTTYEVINLNENVGHTSPWTSGATQAFAKNIPFIVSDPDVIPTDEAHGAVKLFCDLLTRHPERRKAGFGLKLDDLPDFYELKDYVISWEKQFWVSKVEEDVYDAEIDTTFAVYRQNTPYVLGPGLRTGGKYVARHEPWYLDSKKLTTEVAYYRSHANKSVGSWGTDESELTDTYMNHAYKQKLESH